MPKQMTTVAVLKKARGFIEKGWTQTFNAVGKNGAEVEPESRRACRWCAEGAIIAALGGWDDMWHYENASDVVRRTIGAGSLPEWNDKRWRTKAQVLRAFDKAIKIAEKEADHHA